MRFRDGNRWFFDELSDIAVDTKFFQKRCDVPYGKDTSSLSKTRLLLNTTDSLLKDGRDLGGRSLGLSSVGTDLLGGSREGAGNSRANLLTEANSVSFDEAQPQRVNVL